MGRRYRRYYKRRGSYRGGSGNAGPAAIVLVVLGLFTKYWVVSLLIAVSVVIIVAVRYFVRRTVQEDNNSEASVLHVPPKASAATAVAPSYASKGAIMTDCEKEYFKVIRQLVEPKYTVQPQINLASVVSKESHSKYRSELFRNVDFGIFDRDYNIKVLIEINDKTHTQADRVQRDQKVNQICAEAGIPLITFWTKYGINPEYMRSRLSECLDLCEKAVPSAEGPANMSDHSDCLPKDFM